MSLGVDCSEKWGHWVICVKKKSLLTGIWYLPTYGSGRAPPLPAVLLEGLTFDLLYSYNTAEIVINFHYNLLA